MSGLNRIVFVVWAMLFSTNSLSEEIGNTDCSNQGFKNAYYILDMSDIGIVSFFFRSVIENNLKDSEVFSTILGNRQKSEVYYDTKDLLLLNHQHELYHVLDKNLAKYRTDREHVILRDNTTNPTNISVYEIKRYNKKVSPLDKHGLFGRIKRKERPAILKSLNNLIQDNPEKLVPKLQLEHEEIVYLVTHYGESYGQIILDQFHILNFGVPNSFAALKIELFSNAIGQLTKEERGELVTALCGVDDGLRNYITNLNQLPWIGYYDYHNLAERMLPSRSFFQSYPLLFQIGQVGVLCGIGFLMLYLILGRYKKNISYRVTTLPHRNKSS